MGLDSGMVSGKSARLGYDGQKHEYEAWNRDVTLQEAFQASCVWYYKKLVGKLDKSYVQRTLDRLHYGNADISVWNRNGHNVFWIESSLLISPEEQVCGLGRHLFRWRRVQAGARRDSPGLHGRRNRR